MACNAISNPTYEPAYHIISAITNNNPATITTAGNHLFQTGEIVRVRIPKRWGMNELDKATSLITVTGNTTFTIGIDTSLFTLFSIPVTTFQCAYVVPIAESNSMLSGATQNVLRSQFRS